MHYIHWRSRTVPRLEMRRQDLARETEAVAVCEERPPCRGTRPGGSASRGAAAAGRCRPGHASRQPGRPLLRCTPAPQGLSWAPAEWSPHFRHLLHTSQWKEKVFKPINSFPISYLGRQKGGFPHFLPQEECLSTNDILPLDFMVCLPNSGFFFFFFFLYLLHTSFLLDLVNILNFFLS